jgi:hypothetical protein
MARNYFRLIAGLALAGVLIGIAISFGASAHAASAGIDVPGVEVCPKEAPFAQTPESGLAGLLGERPVKITTDNSPDHIWTTGGFAGLQSNTYDLGCGANPGNWVKITSAHTGSSASNFFLSTGDAMVSLTDSIDRRAWQPTWLLSFLDDFMFRVTGMTNTLILLPFFGLTLMLAGLILVWRSSDGDYSAAATSVGWIFIVFSITSLLISTPLLVPKLGTGVGSTSVAVLNGGDNASDAVTNQVVKNVEYQGWLRRNFGPSDTAVGKQYGPELLAASRVSWAELDVVNALPADKQAKARADLTDAKAKKFEDIAAKVKEADPTAYKYLTGEIIGTQETIVEVIFLFMACALRLMVAILMIACVISLALISILWVLLTPAIVQPPSRLVDGRSVGTGLLNGSMRALLYVGEAALGAWLYGFFLQACMAPGLNLWWSLLLLTIGTIIAWLMIGPFGKLMSILSLGKADTGASYVGRAVKGALVAWGGGAIAGLIAATKVNKHEDEEREEAPERLSETVQQPQIVHATVYSPYEHQMDGSVHTEFTPDHDRTLPTSTTPELPMYRRGEQPAPPPDETTSPYATYERTDENEGAHP